MHKVLTLPELLLDVLHLADNHSVAQATRVCHLWSSLALDVLWGRTPVKLYRSSKIESGSPALLNTMPVFCMLQDALYAQTITPGIKEGNQMRTTFAVQLDNHEINNGSEHGIFLRIVCIFLFGINGHANELHLSYPATRMQGCPLFSYRTAP